jgi:hypothetical protein
MHNEKEEFISIIISVKHINELWCIKLLVKEMSHNHDNNNLIMIIIKMHCLMTRVRETIVFCCCNDYLF